MRMDDRLVRQRLAGGAPPQTFVQDALDSL
jgi:hypothetical protein